MCQTVSKQIKLDSSSLTGLCSLCSLDCLDNDYRHITAAKRACWTHCLLPTHSSRTHYAHFPKLKKTKTKGGNIWDLGHQTHVYTQLSTPLSPSPPHTLNTEISVPAVLLERFCQCSVGTVSEERTLKRPLKETEWVSELRHNNRYVISLSGRLTLHGYLTITYSPQPMSEAKTDIA